MEIDIVKWEIGKMGMEWENGNAMAIHGCCCLGEFEEFGVGEKLENWRSTFVLGKGLVLCFLESLQVERVERRNEECLDVR